MTWVRLDDLMPHHNKVSGLSDAAFRVHISAICYAAHLLTNGEITHGAVRVNGWQRRTKELVEARLWDPIPAGYMIHDYLVYNPSKEKVEAENEQAKQRMQRWRKRDGYAVTNGVTDGERTHTPESRIPILSVSNPPTPRRLSPEQELTGLYLRDQVHRVVLKGTNAPDTDWCSDLVMRGATDTDVDYATQQCVQREVKDLSYFRKILERRVEERENGIDHGQLARDRAESARSQPHGRSSGSRGVARDGEGPGALSEFGALPPDAIRPADHAPAVEESPAAGAPLSFPGRAQAGGGAR